MSYKPVSYTIKIFGLNVKDLTFSGRIIIEFETTDDENSLNSIPVNINTEKLEILEIKIQSHYTKTESEIAIEKCEVAAEQSRIIVKLQEKLMPNVKKNFMDIYFKSKINDSSVSDNAYGVYQIASVTDKLPGTVLGADFSKDSNIIPNISHNENVDISLSLSVPEHWAVASNGPIVDSKSVAFDGKKGAEHLSEKLASDVSELKEVKFDTVNIKLSDLQWTALIK